VASKTDQSHDWIEPVLSEAADGLIVSASGHWRRATKELLARDDGQAIAILAAGELRLLKICLDDKYPMVMTRGRKFTVHRLVCLAFRGPAPSAKAVVLHHDDNPRNNHWTNLEWGTAAQNAADTHRNGCRGPRTRNVHRRFSAKEVEAIRRLAASGGNLSQLARRYDMGETTLQKLVSGRTYADCPGPLQQAPRPGGRPRGLRSYRAKNHPSLF